MCGRFFVDAKNREIDRMLEALPAGSPPVKTGEIFPTNIALVLGETLDPEAMSWGFPRWDGKGVVFNARIETAAQKPMFRKSLRERRLLVPCSGFYEWRQEGVHKIKYLFEGESDLLYLAGIWNYFSETGNHFTILTSEASPWMSSWHSRMPVIIPKNHIMAWLKSGETTASPAHLHASC